MPAAIRGGHCALRRRPGPPVEHQRPRPVPRAGVRVHAALGVSAGSPLLFWKALWKALWPHFPAACFRSEQDESAQNAGGDFGFGDGADFNGDFNDLGNESIQIGAHRLDSRQLSLSTSAAEAVSMLPTGSPGREDDPNGVYTAAGSPVASFPSIYSETDQSSRASQTYSQGQTSLMRCAARLPSSAARLSKVRERLTLHSFA